jgi:hypothetical protein
VIVLLVFNTARRALQNLVTFFFSCLVCAIPNVAFIVVQESHDGAADYTSACEYLRQLVGDTYMGGVEMTATSNLTEHRQDPTFNTTC